MNKTEAMWLVTRGFGLYLLVLALGTFFTFLYYCESFALIYLQTREMPATTFDWKSANLTPMVHNAVLFLVYFFLGRYLVLDGGVVHRWCTKGWKPSDGLPTGAD